MTLPFFKVKLPIFGYLYLISILFLFFFSFTQVDLGLTLTRASIFTDIQKAFQYIGYFNRPLSTSLFVGILAILFIFYGLFLSRVKSGLLSRSVIWTMLIITALILSFSYNLLSYDIFNYIFDAKIWTKYGLNPYEHKALDFPADPMLSFMHWTHRTYPYGPVWLGLTIPLSFAGLQYFLPTFLLFKFLMAGAYLGTAYFIEKILKVTNRKYALLGLTAFAFNPLVLFEGLISAHNDIVMMFFCMIGIYFFVKEKYVQSTVILLLSVGIKFATGFLLPLLFTIFLFRRKKIDVPWESVWLIFIITMFFALIAASMRTNFQPWYMLYVIPFASLISHKKYIIYPTVILSLVALLNYVPYLYFGNWDDPIPLMLNYLNGFIIFLSIILIFIFRKSS